MVTTRAGAYRRQGERVFRFVLAERAAHWFHAISFLVLLATGLALVVRGAAAFLGGDVMRTFGLTHRIVAVIFTVVAVPVLMLGARKSTGEWVRSAFRFDRDDFRFLAGFPKDFFGVKVTLPDQGRFNAGEKINSIFQIIGWFVMVVTGWMLVWKDALPRDLARWTLATHSFTALFLGAVVLGHIYLASIHPHARPGFTGMTSGWVPAWWAQGHYRKWYNKLPGE
ncbi:MAG: formate dehydrogenase gamma subunit [Symbiobacteriaceae bacterium]|jgi:formate dehydrogenase subunit gamma|nr:formate dehydrogenase gamma subunit [Symbiobacteriaceae bacterium]